MDARCLRIAIVVTALASVAATHRTPNFIVTAPTPEIAQQVGAAAEVYRRELAIEWTGQKLPNWYAPCKVQVNVGQVGAGGATSFSFDRGEVFGWNMTIQGPLDRLLDSVLPHEISHTIFACYFRRPLPRWADEGAATLAETDSEKQRQVMTVRQVLGTTKRIPLRTLVGMREYPSEMRDVLTLYAEGYSLAELLVQEGGKARYLAFLLDSETIGWDRAINKHYGYSGIDGLEKEWHSWVFAGSPARKAPDGTQFVAAPAKSPAPAVAAAAPAKPAAPQELVVRGQAPDEDPFLNGTAVAMATGPANPKLRKSDLTAPAPRRTPVSAAALAAKNATSKPAAAASQQLPAKPLPKKTALPLDAEPVGVADTNESAARLNGDQPLLKDLNRGWVTVTAATTTAPVVAKAPATTKSPAQPAAPARQVSALPQRPDSRTPPNSPNTRGSRPAKSKPLPNSAARPAEQQPLRMASGKAPSRTTPPALPAAPKRTQWSEFPQ